MPKNYSTIKLKKGQILTGFSYKTVEKEDTEGEETLLTLFFNYL